MPAQHAAETLSVHRDFPPTGAKRIDLHCHTSASNEADEAMLNAINCPESFSSPQDVYDQAKRRSMDFVCITDHDTLEGVKALMPRTDVLVGEELTCYFPEDRCKMHVLVWGLSDDDHRELQAVAGDIYGVATYIEQRRLAHAVAHPVYRQNDRLERWHLERLMLLFKGFEVLNGAHSALHRESFEPMLDQLTPRRIEELSRKHLLLPLWPEPHVKARTGGSDDHGLFNIGRTWTEFPADVTSVEGLLSCLRTGRCRPAGEAGSSVKLAHNFFSVGVRYFGRQFVRPQAKPTLSTSLLQMLVGERKRLRKRDVVRMVLREQAGRFGRFVTRPFRRATDRPQPTGAALLVDLFLKSFRQRVGDHPTLAAALDRGLAPLGEHAAMFRFVSDINRDVADGIARSVARALDQGDLAGMFDAISSVALQQFILLPYYFALFHQNRERRDLGRITGHGARLATERMRVGVFSDTFDEINGVGRFIRDMGERASHVGRQLSVCTCTDRPAFTAPYRQNFRPLVAWPMPLYREQRLVLPPLLEILEWADRQQFDAVHVHTPGPMGLCGLAVARMLRIPVLGTYHTDFPAYVHALTGGDHRLTSATSGYMSWFYGQLTRVLSRSRQYLPKVQALQVPDERIGVALPCVDDVKFNPSHRDIGVWARHGVREQRKLLYCGRVSAEKNLALLADAFAGLCARRQDVALVVVGDGPYLQELRRRLANLPAYFLGYRQDADLGSLYASSDLFVFPSRTDTLGQVVIEAQSSGLPVLVSDEGGPKEVMDDQLTGLVLPGQDAGAWVNAIDQLLSDEPRRQRMSRTATSRMARYTAPATFESFWDEHAQAAHAARARDEAATPAEPATLLDDPDQRPVAMA